MRKPARDPVPNSADAIDTVVGIMRSQFFQAIRLESERIPVGEMMQVAVGVRRIICDNPSAYTLNGTCTYIVGEGRVSVIDPGPANVQHIERLLGGLRGERVERILISHAHTDHSLGAAILRTATGAPVWGYKYSGEDTGNYSKLSNDPDDGVDRTLDLDEHLRHGEVVNAGGLTFQVLHSRGHSDDHLMFSLDQRVLFTGDHLLGWSPTFIAPDSHSMAAYRDSIQTLLSCRPYDEFLPGHGASVKDTEGLLKTILEHRAAREERIFNRLIAGDRTVTELLRHLYRNLDSTLIPAAISTVYAHLLDLIERGYCSMSSEGPISERSIQVISREVAPHLVWGNYN